VKPAVRISRPLGLGARGREVVEFQLRLQELGFDPGRADGRYGPATERAVRAFQQTYGLPVTGRGELDVLFLLGLL